MQIRLIVDGGDQRIRIKPKSKSDKKLLDYIVCWDSARVVGKKETYGHDLEYIDLVLEMKTDGETVGVPQFIPEA